MEEDEKEKTEKKTEEVGQLLLAQSGYVAQRTHARSTKDGL